MGQLILDLLPLVIGVMLSPLAIMALVAILVSDRARVNGSFYLVGWVLGLSIVLAVSCWILLAIDIHTLPDAPLWIAWVRIVIGLFVGISMIFNGWTWVMLALALRSRTGRLGKTTESVTTAKP